MKKMTIAVIKFDNEIVGICENIIFPKVRKTVKIVHIHNHIKIYEDNTLKNRILLNMLQD